MLLCRCGNQGDRVGCSPQKFRAFHFVNFNRDKWEAAIKLWTSQPPQPKNCLLSQNKIALAHPEYLPNLAKHLDDTWIDWGNLLSTILSMIYYEYSFYFEDIHEIVTLDWRYVTNIWSSFLLVIIKSFDVIW